VIRKCAFCRSQLASLFRLPDLFWSEYCKRSNGYFGCENVYGSGGLSSHSTFDSMITQPWQNIEHSIDTWFRFHMKQVLQHYLPDGKDYVWYNVNVLSTWQPGGKNAIISFDTHDFLKPKILSFLLNTQSPKNDPYWVHSSFLQEVASMQDEAVWSVRDFVRNTETVSDDIGRSR